MRVLELHIRPIQILWLLVLFSFVVPQTAAAAEASYLTFQVPGALGTFPMSMNNSMTVTGYYTTSPSTASAFIRDATGTITTFSVRGGLWTEPESINDAGDITGFYEVVAGFSQGFVRHADGRIVTFEPPESLQAGDFSQPVAINNFGEIAGNHPVPFVASGGFTRSKSGSFQTFSGDCGAAYPVGILGLNSNGAVVGFGTCSDPYTDGGGFISRPDGSPGGFGVPGGYLVGIDVPVSGRISSKATIPEAINDGGVVAGWYNVVPPRDVGGPPVSGGFIRSRQGDYTVFNPPGKLVPPALELFFLQAVPPWAAPKSLSLNASGVIAGTYTHASGTKHGFVRNPYGTITTFDPPRGTQTTANSINDSGVIAGAFYYDWNLETSVGFLRIPSQ